MYVAESKPLFARVGIPVPREEQAVTPADAAGNCAAGGGRLMTEGASGNIVYAEDGQLTALIGVDALVVVRAGAAVLVCPTARAQDPKRIVARPRDGSPTVA